jgi:hypothetical protein
MGLAISWTAPVAYIKFLHTVHVHESGAVGKCVRNGLKIQFWLEQKLQLPSLIYQESSCIICSS